MTDNTGYANIPNNGGSRVDKTYQEILDDREFLVTGESVKDDYHYDTAKQTKPTMNKEGVFGVFTSSQLNYLYFHEKNIKSIQNKIRYTIWKMSKNQFVISDQKQDDLFIIMRSVFLKYSRNLPTNIKEQINELNEIVVDSIAQKLLTNVKSHVKYLEDINSPYKIMERPRNTSSTGMKTMRIDTKLGFGDTPSRSFGF
jgi:hypothetical protein